MAVALVIVVQLALPPALSFGPHWLLPVAEGVLLAALVIANPNHLDAHSTELRQLSIATIVMISAKNVASLVLLVHQMLVSDSALPGATLIYSAVGIWLTNIVAFGVWYWEIDRGGPGRRCRVDHREPDFLFVQMGSPRVAAHAWSPNFVDYLYVSLTNSTAFSPTDTLPLTWRAKVLMSIQSLASLVTVAAVAARGINILGGS